MRFVDGTHFSHGALVMDELLVKQTTCLVGIDYLADVMLLLFKTKVRLYMEYSVQFWSPHDRKHMNKLERVQKTFTRMVLGLVGLSNRETLGRLGLFSLE